MNTMTLVLFSLMAFSSLAAENCRVFVNEKAYQLEEQLIRRGYILVGKSDADYEVRFENFVASPVEIEEKLVAIKGHGILKIYKRVESGKRDLQFAMKSSGSVSTCQGTCIKSFSEGVIKLHSVLINAPKLRKTLPSCRELD
jgi:hypothetical protein